MSRTRLAELRLAPGRRVICISDVHGHRSHLDRLLEKLRFTADDFLIVIGDAVECGPEPLGALRRIMALEKAGCARMLAGNWEYQRHELFMSDDPEISAMLLNASIAGRDDDGGSLLTDMCAEIGISLCGDSDMRTILPRIREAFSEELEYMGSLPVILDAGDFVCVHGGLNTLNRAELLSDPDEYGFLKNDAFAQQGHAFERWIITGHWPVANYDREVARYSPHVFPKQRIVAIDGGCGKQLAAQLNALIMYAGRPGEFEWDFADDFPRARALDAQRASQGSIHTVWDTRFIDVLEKGAEFAKVRHHASGRILEVPIKRLWLQQGVEVLGDFTDYMLPVEPGDVLSILFETSRGLYCKKADVIGWYAGSYETTTSE